MAGFAEFSGLVNGGGTLIEDLTRAFEEVVPYVLEKYSFLQFVAELVAEAVEALRSETFRIWHAGPWLPYRCWMLPKCMSVEQGEQENVFAGGHPRCFSVGDLKSAELALRSGGQCPLRAR